MEKNTYLNNNILINSRRSFIKKGTAGIITAMAAPSIISCANSNESGKKKLGLALMGLGYYSTDILAPSIQMCKNTYLAGIITGTPSKAEEWSAKYKLKKENIYNYENFDEIANNKEIDIVYVVVPNGLHKEFTIRAAKAGKHVLCEKPMAANAAECREMIAKAGPGGGYILSASGCLSEGTPLENIEAMVRAAERYGRYPLSL